jgi:hypothetical protein
LFKLHRKQEKLDTIEINDRCFRRRKKQVVYLDTNPRIKREKRVREDDSNESYTSTEEEIYFKKSCLSSNIPKVDRPKRAVARVNYVIDCEQEEEDE